MFQRKLFINGERKIMEWINNISNLDSVISDIEIKNSCLVVYVKLWNGVVKKVKFNNYYIFKDKNSIGEEIGDIKVQANSIMLEELRQDILNGGGTLNEIVDVKSITFYNASNDKIILEVLSDKIVYE